MLKSLISNSRRRQFFNLLVFYAAYLWFRSFSSSVLSPHFLQSGVSLEQMVFGSAIAYIIPVLILLFSKIVSNLIWWRWAIGLAYLAIILVIKVVDISQYYLYSLLLGSNTALFFVPYNIAHFKLTPGHRTGFSSGILFSVYPVIALIAPLTAGLLAEFDYIYIWILSAFFFGVSFYLVKFQVQIKFNLDLKRDFDYLKPTRLIVLLQGVWETLIFGIIPIYTLYFLTTPLAYGSYLSYLALMGVLANLFLGKLSDKLKDRLKFLYPVTISMALITLIFPLSLNRLILWLIFTGIIQLLTPLFWNFSTAWFVDKQPDHVRSMPARELILNVGRVIGLFLTWLNFSFQSPPVLIFYFLGAVMLLYPLVLVYNTRNAARS